MRLLIEGTPEEFHEKRTDLLKALVDKFQHVDADLADILEKSLPNKEPVLKFRALEQMRRRTSAQYRDMLDKMLEEIGQVLDGKLSKADTEVKDSGGGEDDQDPDEDSEGNPIFNDQGETPTEEKERIAKEGPDEDDGGEETEKSEKSGLALHINDVHEREKRAYDRIKRVLIGRGYREDDFSEPGGAFYGWSVNQLLEVARPS